MWGGGSGNRAGGGGGGGLRRGASSGARRERNDRGHHDKPVPPRSWRKVKLFVLLALVLIAAKFLKLQTMMGEEEVLNEGEDGDGEEEVLDGGERGAAGGAGGGGENTAEVELPNERVGGDGDGGGGGGGGGGGRGGGGGGSGGGGGRGGGGGGGGGLVGGVDALSMSVTTSAPTHAEMVAASVRARQVGIVGAGAAAVAGAATRAAARDATAATATAAAAGGAGHGRGKARRGGLALPAHIAPVLNCRCRRCRRRHACCRRSGPDPPFAFQLTSESILHRSVITEVGLVVSA